jgi:hypothetical protein
MSAVGSCYQRIGEGRDTSAHVTVISKVQSRVRLLIQTRQ